jgi:inorganic pyrophosphatase
MMEDDGGEDEKILAVPAQKLHPYHDAIKTYTDLPKVQLEQIRHFFEHYKDLEAGKWSKIIGWKDHDAAAEIIEQAIARYNSTQSAA